MKTKAPESNTSRFYKVTTSNESAKLSDKSFYDLFTILRLIKRTEVVISICFMSITTLLGNYNIY
ncbi:CLUMA_CG000933, isoform A [Clunio marinus]|uniref:CLUMA_CG000933, isoform A n=1 Tax=Clunio marinus TaxID=568069 RepID=A0A1J1HHT6_9DIPT|nr:CLUMA_CG000933, isoform A [Clunio marinus]